MLVLGTWPAAVHAQDDWLGEINRYRDASGLARVADQPAWDAGLLNHLRYLASTPSAYRTGPYASAHTENPQSPYYTAIGAAAAATSDLLEGGATTPVGSIDAWLTAPFHAIGMLRPQLTQVAFAEDPATGFAGLDVIRGLDLTQVAPNAPVVFPGPGITTNLSAYSGAEAPSPLETCGWQDAAGLPLIVLLGHAPDPALSARTSGPAGQFSTGAGDLCVVDERTYVSSDPVYGPTGAQILQGDHAVLLIPRRPLDGGGLSVVVSEPGRPDLSWSFQVALPAPVNTGAPAIAGRPQAGQTLTVVHGAWRSGDDDVPVVSDQWQRCDGAACVDIPGATGASYTTSGTDVGHAVRVLERAVTRGGAAQATSAATAAIAPAPRGTKLQHLARASRRAALRVDLTLHGRYGTFVAPSWLKGLRVSMTLFTQRRSCARCRWATVRRRHATFKVAGRRTSLSVGTRRRGDRLRVTLTVPRFVTADGWTYPGLTVRRREG